jgi:hypothetical protein
VQAQEQAELLREGVALMLREVMEMDVASLAGAERYVRSGGRAAYEDVQSTGGLSGCSLMTWAMDPGTSPCSRNGPALGP